MTMPDNRVKLLSVSQRQLLLRQPTQPLLLRQPADHHAGHELGPVAMHEVAGTGDGDQRQVLLQPIPGVVQRGGQQRLVVQAWWMVDAITLVDAIGILSVGQRPSASPLSSQTAVLFAALSPGATPAFLAPLSLGPRVSLASITGSVVGGAAASPGDRGLLEVGAGAPANPAAQPTTSDGGHAPPALDSFEACDACFCAVGAERAAGKHDQPFQCGDSVLDAPQARIATSLALAVLLGGYCRLDSLQRELDAGKRLEKRRRCES
jgi:hypothetical protein